MPSPGMITIVCFAIERFLLKKLSSLPERPRFFSSASLAAGRMRSGESCFCPESPLGNNCAFQLLPDKLLNPSRDHQRLRNAAQRREGKLLSRITDRASRKINIDLVAGDKGPFAARTRRGIDVAQMPHERGAFDTQESVVESVAQIGLREAGGNHQRNAFCPKRGYSLLTA